MGQMRFFINMLLLPVSFIVSSYLLLSSGWRLDDNPIYGHYAIYMLYSGYLFAAAGVVIALAKMWKVWQAYHGKGSICGLCGGRVDKKIRRLQVHVT